MFIQAFGTKEYKFSIWYVLKMNIKASGVIHYSSKHFEPQVHFRISCCRMSFQHLALRHIKFSIEYYCTFISVPGSTDCSCQHLVLMIFITVSVAIECSHLYLLP